jgi:hypothetical protein
MDNRKCGDFSALEEGVEWKSETKIPPWRIYILTKAET